MSMVQPAQERAISGASSLAIPLPSSQTSRPHRVLACVLCHQRKVKCDRKFPCSNCVRSRTECVPATVVRRRPRRRFPEKDLLERVRRYEELLNQNNIKFEPLHASPAAEKLSPNVEGGYDSDEDQPPDATGANTPSPSATARSEKGLHHSAKNFWDAMRRGFRDQDNEDESYLSDDDVREAVFKKAWNELAGNNVFLALGSRKIATPLSALHPDPVQIFRFWQIYLDNVNPLVKVIHAPSLQGRIIEAAGNLGNIDPTFEALLFSIYCMSITSLSKSDCQAMFGSPKEDLLATYQSGCQQALLNCGFLRSNDRDCLTALYLYIHSVGHSTDPISLHSMLGIVHRIAQRLGIHNESISADCTPFEAEMRRRLWWSIVIFDWRIGEMADHKSVSLNPIWDCRVPLNVNDSDLRPEMKEAPTAQAYPSDAIYATVRSELGEHIRHSNFHLDFVNPALKSVAKEVQQDVASADKDLATLERMIEDRYLKLCDPEIPLHFITMWTTRGYLAKYRLVQQYSRYGGSPRPSPQQIDATLDIAIPFSFGMLECDTKIMKSPLVKGFTWLSHFYFPFPAYMHLVQDLRRRPVSKHAEEAWEKMYENCEARFTFVSPENSSLFMIFSKAILSAWNVREAPCTTSGQSLARPKIVSFIKSKLAELAQASHAGQDSNAGEQQPTDFMSLDDSDFPMPMSIGFGGANSFLFGMGMGGQDAYAGTGPGVYPGIPAQSLSDIDVNQVDWAAMDWGLGEQRHW